METMKRDDSREEASGRRCSGSMEKANRLYGVNRASSTPIAKGRFACTEAAAPLSPEPASSGSRKR